MRQSLLVKIGLIAFIVCIPFYSHSIPTAKEEISSFKDLDQGEPKGTLVSSDAEVLAGRDAVKLNDVTSAIIWSRTQDRDGTTYFGTGDQGNLLQVKNKKVSVIANLKSVLITALAIGPDQKILAATMPDAHILEVDPKNGKWHEIAKLPSKHIWALIYDTKSRTIFAATGAPGKIFAIPYSNKTPKVLFDPKENHLLCLVSDYRGRLLTGGSEKAILYRVDLNGKGTAIHDFDATELRDVVVDKNGTIFVVVNKFPQTTSGLPRYDQSKDGEAGTAMKKVKGPSEKTQASELRPGAKTGKGALYRIDTDGRTEELINLTSGYFTDLEVDPSSTVWVAEGTKGKIYWVQNNRKVLSAFDFPERQVLALAVSGQNQFVATGDAGAVYRIIPGSATTPTYLSKVIDTKFHSQWGNIVTKAAGKISVFSRSGNTSKPDDTWYGWNIAKNPIGDRIHLTSAPARYVQLKFVWQRPYDTILRSFMVYYKPQNQRAIVKEIKIAKKIKKENISNDSTIPLEWEIDNPDNDELIYRLYYREETGVAWRPITKEDQPLDKPKYSWNTESIADDHYRVKVVASDERANSPQDTLSNERISDIILVDNRKPEITGLTLKFPWVAGLARDSYSTIMSIEYSLDGLTWKLVAPQDGIFDSTSEGFRFKLSADLNSGTHIVAIRIRDAADNLGVAHIRFVK